MSLGRVFCQVAHEAEEGQPLKEFDELFSGAAGSKLSGALS